MSQCNASHVLVLPRLRVENANAISSPMTHGFPSMTAFLGFMWALERKLSQRGQSVHFNAVGVVCHDFQEQVSDGYPGTFNLTRNPIWGRQQTKLIGSDGSAGTPAIAEEGRIHLNISLLLGFSGVDDKKALQAEVARILPTMRVAGGTLLPRTAREHHLHQPFLLDLTGTLDDQREVFAKERYKLLPGFALVSRDDALEDRFDELKSNNSEATRLDAWLSLVRSEWRYEADDEQPKKGQWKSTRKPGDGWLVPIPVGYGALGELHEPGSIANARDKTTPFRFVESVYSVGQWISPHRTDHVSQLLWYADSHADEGLYRCRNDFKQPPEMANESNADLYQPIDD